jgi:hypothetical protein
MAIKNKAVELPKAALPKATTNVNASYWTQLPKTSDEYGKILDKVIDELNKSHKNSGYSIYVRKSNRFKELSSAKYTEKMFLFLEANYWSYTTKAGAEAIQYIIDHFQLNDQNARLSPDRKHVEFMYDGVLVEIGDPSERLRKANSNPESQITNVIYGYGGELYKVIKILLNKFGFDFTDEAKFQFKLMEGESVYKTYEVATGLDSLYKLLGTSSRNAPYMFNFTKRSEFADWAMGSRYIGKSTFDIDEHNNYVGPVDYYGSSLYRELVHIIREKYVSDADKATPEVLPETIRKYQNKFWEARSVYEYKKMLKDMAVYQERKIIRNKFTDTMIMEVTGTNNKEEIDSFKLRFENHISNSEDFSFFLLSSSEDTIREKIAAFRASN